MFGKQKAAPSGAAFHSVHSQSDERNHSPSNSSEKQIHSHSSGSGGHGMGTNITEGVIWKQLLYLFFPILIGSLFQQLYNTADTMIVGRFVGKNALSAVGSCGSIVNLLLDFFVGLSSGAAVIIAQVYGARDEDGVSKAVHTSMALSIVSGMIMLIAGLLTVDLFMDVLNVPAEVLPDARSYIRIYYLGMVPSMVYNMGNGTLRAVGDTKTPLYILIVCCVANIVLDLLFVITFRMGVAGAALATVLAQTVSAVLVLWVLMRSRDSFRIDLRRIRSDRQKLGRIVRIGIPAGLQSSMYGISNLIIYSVINSLGTEASASWSALSKIDSFIWLVLNAFGIAITTFVGQNFGAGRYDRVRKSARECLFLAIPSTVFLSMGFYLAGPAIFSLFTTDPQVIGIGVSTLRIMCPFYWTFSFVTVYSGTIRGCGEALLPMIITCLCNCVLRVVWVMFIVPIHPGMTLVAWCYPVTWASPAVIFIIYYFRMNWLKRCDRQRRIGDTIC